jgi:hypothetical protein
MKYIGSVQSESLNGILCKKVQTIYTQHVKFRLYSICGN